MAESEVWIGGVPYGNKARAWLQQQDHYLGNAPPGCLYAVGVMHAIEGLFEGVMVGDGHLRGLCLVGRPVARVLPQDGSVGEVTRLWLEPGLPYGTASAVLRKAAALGQDRGMVALISYHERQRHTGCIYKKAGFKRDGVIKPRNGGWSNRNRSDSAGEAGRTSKRRWRLDLAAKEQA